MATGLKVTNAIGTGLGVPLPVIGRKIGPAGLGIRFASICCARATAVLFKSATERSFVLRACRSRAVGGVELRLAITNTIQAIPPQINRAAKA